MNIPTLTDRSRSGSLIQNGDGITNERERERKRERERERERERTRPPTTNTIQTDIEETIRSTTK